MIDDVIDPRETRPTVIRALRMAETKRVERPGRDTGVDARQAARVQAIFFDGPEAPLLRLARGESSSEPEVLVGFYKKATGKQTMTWSQAVDQALCFGWIDGVMRRLDDERHIQRFTPRRPGSNWSRVNVEKMERLEAEGLVAPAGRRAFEARSDANTGVYSFEEGQQAAVAGIRAAPARKRRGGRVLGRQAALVPPHREHWVLSAKREETRERRLAQLIEDSAKSVDIKPLRLGR